MANMSAIYEYLGASADQIPILWLAAPLTGSIVHRLSVMPVTAHGAAAKLREESECERQRPTRSSRLGSVALSIMPISM
jgi:hypothetical protein